LKKTGVLIRIHVDDRLLHDVIEYSKTLSEGDYLFYSRENQKDRPVTRQHVARVLRAVGASVGLDHISTHSMRRTYAVGLYRACNDLLTVQRALGHKYLSSTLCYMLDADRRLVL